MDKRKVLGGLIAFGAVAVILVTVRGWSDNDTGRNEGTPDDTGKGDGGVVVEELGTYNTDTPFENLTIEIVEYKGENMVYKVTNDSNVCYKYLAGTTYFTCDPLPGRLPLKEGQEYYNSFSFDHIPAHSVTYHLHYSFLEVMGKGDNVETVTMYYPFEFGTDSCRIEMEEESASPHSSKVSDVVIQDAIEYVEFESDYDEATNRLGTITNTTNRAVRFSGYVRFANGYMAEIQNGTDITRSRTAIPPYGEIIKDQGEVLDYNSIYTFPFDFENSVEDYQVIIGNAYFAEDVEWTEE